MDYDSLLESFGGISSRQVTYIGLSALLLFGVNLLLQNSVFLSAVPQHRCLIPNLNVSVVHTNLTEENITAFTIPPGDSCHRYAYNLSECTVTDEIICPMNQSEVGTMECDQGYYYDDTYFGETTITEWDLVCGDEVLDAAANSAFFLGTMVGSVAFGSLMDRYGRKLGMLILCIGEAASGVACSLAPNFGSYVFFRFLTGVNSVPVAVCAFAHACEICDKRSRIMVGVWFSIASTIAHVILPGIAYGLRDWRQFNLICSLVPALYLPFHPFFPESPRWLLTKGKDNEAKAVVSQFAKSKKKTLDENVWASVAEVEKRKMDCAKVRYHAPDLFRKPFMRIVTMVMCFNWFVVSLIYYGLVLNVGTLAGDPYVNSFLNAATEFLAIVLYYILCSRTGRKFTLCSTLFMAGACCLTTMLVTELSPESQAALQSSRWISILGKLFAAASMSTLYQYSADLYPTVVRGTAMGLGSFFARVGSAVMPFILLIQYNVPWLTQAIFGSLAIFATVSSVVLPESASTELTTTMEEAENFYRENMHLVSKLITNRNTESRAIDEKYDEDKSHDNLSMDRNENYVITRM